MCGTPSGAYRVHARWPRGQNKPGCATPGAAASSGTSTGSRRAGSGSSTMPSTRPRSLQTRTQSARSRRRTAQEKYGRCPLTSTSGRIAQNPNTKPSRRAAGSDSGAPDQHPQVTASRPRRGRRRAGRMRRRGSRCHGHHRAIDRLLPPCRGPGRHPPDHPGAHLHLGDRHPPSRSTVTPVSRPPAGTIPSIGNARNADSPLSKPPHDGRVLRTA